MGDIVRAGWVTKESRHWGRWRLRWLELVYEEGTSVPNLCSYKAARMQWPEEPPRPTERLPLVGATCFPCPDDGTMAAGRPHAFALNLRGRDFVFATETADEAVEWVRSLSLAIAELALRLGGVEPSSMLAGGNSELRGYIAALHGSLDAVALGQVNRGIEELLQRKGELEAELEAAREARAVAAAASPRLGPSSPRASPGEISISPAEISTSPGEISISPGEISTSPAEISTSPAPLRARELAAAETEVAELECDCCDQAQQIACRVTADGRESDDSDRQYEPFRGSMARHSSRLSTGSSTADLPAAEAST
ncbi:hypothetical protein EMIHUDRAFT_215105 [Emiliania huxleyi CCMP1516]|uniref:PH domain-containing protein n=2 Tax=Emiliania huxleyi TaxID=2903 RepID=A0A0D3IHX7_EMIH1|nr:hypothetical protein EMIHUDRAFT_215105 [Emiliania huxleyi CCMP1516]EOD10862.1 hypothetical protein EMIHUDRAFT_215105 [Emiliania huxleyi CCMP1516]|eukprot:XP_005763291.1 hypothetical protein EMIHUDRAFT_215105 [Emiliania huxleyi CCMP1516]